jgi:putative flippase GtrA
MRQLILKHVDKLRFALVGGFNTLLDFGILFLLVSFGVDKIIGNFFSTSLAFIFSFFANKSFTFQSKGGNVKRQFALFLIITLFGLWVLQPIVIMVVSFSISSLHLNSSATLLISKFCATIVSLVWNYVFYSRFVFKKVVS